MYTNSALSKFLVHKIAGVNFISYVNANLISYSYTLELVGVLYNVELTWHPAVCELSQLLH